MSSSRGRLQNKIDARNEKQFQESRILTAIRTMDAARSLTASFVLPDGSQMAARLSALRAGRPFPPPQRRFLIFIYIRGWVNHKAIVRQEGSRKLKNKNQWQPESNPDLPACSIVPQITMLPHVPVLFMLPDKNTAFISHIYSYAYNVRFLCHPFSLRLITLLSLHLPILLVKCSP
jgi:hypothetical protein